MTDGKGYPGMAKGSTMPMYRMPDGSYVTDEKLARETWIKFLELERRDNGGSR